MNKQKNNRLFIFLGTLALVLGFGSSLKTKDITKTSAAPITEGTVLYLKPNSNWLQAGAWFSAYFFGDDGDAWISLTKEEGVQDIYKVVSPAARSFTNVIFTRMNPATTGNNWGNTWNQTDDLVYDGTNNLFTVPVGVWDKPKTTWSVYDSTDHSIIQIIPIIPETEFFVRVNSTFMADGDRVEGYFFNDGEDAWALGTQVEPGIWKVETPLTTETKDSWNKMIFVSLLGEAADNWTIKQVQTDDLIWDGEGNLWDVETSTWQTFVPGTKLGTVATPEGINSSKVRIWLDRGGHYLVGYQWALKVGETYHLPTGYQEALVDGTHFAYYDLPIVSFVGNLELVVVDNFDVEHFRLDIGAYIPGDNSKLWRISDEDMEEFARGPVVGRVLNTFVAKVLEGYMSCLSSVDNGYLAFDEIDANFIPRLEGDMWNMEGDLGGILIRDFEDETNYDEGIRETVAATDAYDKYFMLQSMNAAHPESGEFRIIQSNQSSDIFLILGFVTLIGLAGLAFVRYKRKDA